MKNHPSLLRRIPAFLLATLLTLPSVFTSAAVDVLPADTPATTPATTTAVAVVPKASEAGDIAPDFDFTDFNGKEHHLSEFRGKPVLLDIWATWCSPCVAEIPTLRAIHAELANKGFVVLSISIDDSLETAKAYVAKNNMPWTHGHSAGAWKSDIARKFRLNAIPSVWFIGADGKIKAYDLRGTEAKNAARSLLQNKLNFTPVPKVKVSGLVVDEKGKPIAGAKVFLYPTSNLSSCTYAGNLLEDWTFTTDANGVWTCEKMFADVKNLHVGAYHHDYIASREEYYPGEGNFNLEKCTSISDFLAGKQKTVLYPGVRVTGIVRDADGKPKAGVPVSIGQNHAGDFLTPPEITNEKGEFSYAVRSGDTAYFTITPEGFSPDIKTIRSVVKPAHVEFSLQPTQTIKGIVVDENGTPIPGVWINLDRWRDLSSISYNSRSDSQGRFEAKNMPADTVFFGFELERKNFSSYRDVPLKAGKENKIVMIGQTKIFGKVVDAETGEELKKYRLELGTKSPGNEAFHWWVDHDEKRFKELVKFKISPTGVFSIVSSERDNAFVFRASVDGYPSKDSEIVEADGKKHEIVIKLKKRFPKGREEKIQLAIQDSNGKPLGDVCVAQAFTENKKYAYESTRYSHIYYRNGKIKEQGAQVELASSNSAGIFFIPMSEDKYRLTFSHPTGWAKVYSKDLKKGEPVVLTPWQTIRGKAFVGDKPNVGAKIRYLHLGHLFAWEEDMEPLDQIHLEDFALVDTNGNFEIKHAIPGMGFIEVKGDETRTQTIPVISGKTPEVYFGPVGRPVKGRLIMPAQLAGKEKFTHLRVYRADIENKPHSIYVPGKGWLEEGEKLTEEDKDISDLKNFELGEQLRLRYLRRDEISKDGVFQIDDVLPGKYVLETLEPFRTKRTFEVKLDAGKSFMEEPVDLGELNFETDYTQHPKIKSLAVGDLIPDFSFTDLEGKAHRFSEHKGKIILIYGWSAVFPNTRAQLPVIQEIEEKYKAEKKIVILRLNFDTNPEMVKHFIQAKGISGFQGFPEPEAQNYFRNFNSFNDSDVAYLIGADGKVLATKLKGTEKIEEVLSRALVEAK